MPPKEKQPDTYVVMFGDYLPKVPLDFTGSKVSRAIEMIYSENIVVDKIERKGEIFFVCRK